MSKFYDQPLVETYKFTASAVLSSAGVAGRFIGPVGKTGRVLNASAIITTATTDAASEIRVGTAADPDAALAMGVPVAAAAAGHQATAAELKAGALIAADTVYQVSGDGSATAGAADIYVTVGWF